ncbi:sporulation protein YqfD [Bacillus suaedaesalsae]|uniref:Sporulation protein YqfD n=1 Tax=Bacillus suaedaesalsae TaxID=2810349 RepID=A0ABS2DLJ5_9BACI|nr:sporulation protein YqfD [Bacillus suaedaesalsae]MBM6619257.1 sporulation protein YqfD [Bacillus suaedaesalsae]
MKNQWTIFFSGHVKVKIVGKGIERFINQCVRENIVVWEVTRLTDFSITCSLHLKDIHKLRRVVRNSSCKLTFEGGRGLPFLFQKALYNIGFVAGAISFIFILFILSNMVWGIEIEGAEPETEYKIRKELDAIGVEKGKFQFVLKDVNEIQKHLSETINAITWVGVELNGTTYHFQVVEKTQPKEQEFFSPRHLVARKEAVISNMFIEEGQAVVTVNDFVRKGDLLVSGFIGKEGQTEVVSARGKVMGETWWDAKVEVPLKTTLNVLTGKTKTTHYFQLFSLNIPFWGFGKHEFKQVETTYQEKPFYFISWKLPIGYNKKIIRESETVERTYTKEEAIKVGIEDGRKDLKKSLSEDAVIKGEKILQQSVESGKVKLLLLYNVIEEISAVQPIIQGD